MTEMYLSSINRNNQQKGLSNKRLVCVEMWEQSEIHWTNKAEFKDLKHFLCIQYSFFLISNIDLHRFMSNIWEKNACVHRKGLRSLNSSHEEWELKQKCCTYIFVQSNIQDNDPAGE